MRQSTGTTVTLVQAAARLGLSYRQALDLVTRGVLLGWQTDNRHWEIDRVSVERLAEAKPANEPKARVK